jgi:hypothetical protein
MHLHSKNLSVLQFLWNVTCIRTSNIHTTSSKIVSYSFLRPVFCAFSPPVHFLSAKASWKRLCRTTWLFQAAIMDCALDDTYRSSNTFNRLQPCLHCQCNTLKLNSVLRDMLWIAYSWSKNIFILCSGKIWHRTPFTESPQNNW